MALFEEDFKEVFDFCSLPLPQDLKKMTVKLMPKVSATLQ